MSVFEERRARPGWGDNWSLENLKAIGEGSFVKINDLDAAFTRPKTPDGVTLAYFQASQVCEFVDEKFGFDGILKMLALYKEGAKTTDVLQRVLKLSPADFDRASVTSSKQKPADILKQSAPVPLTRRRPGAPEGRLARDGEGQAKRLLHSPSIGRCI